MQYLINLKNLLLEGDYIKKIIGTPISIYYRTKELIGKGCIIILSHTDYIFKIFRENGRK